VPLAVKQQSAFPDQHHDGMPDNTRPPRNLRIDDQPNLGTRALMQAIDDLAKAHHLTAARVAYKRNTKGEHVVALIFTGFERT
jgi:hypothetical protein